MRQETIEVVVETPKGHRNKYRIDERIGTTYLHKVLPEGFSFPFDFGFVPNTKGQDGDPIDILILMDEPAFPECRVKARILGVIRGEQSKGRRSIRNDRIIAVAETSRKFADVRRLSDLNSELLREFELFLCRITRLMGRNSGCWGLVGVMKPYIS